MMYQEASDDLESTAAKAKEVEYFNLKKTIEGTSELVKDFVPDLEDGLLQVDAVVTTLTTKMGQGKSLSKEVGQEYAKATDEILKLGGTQKTAAEIQIKTIETLGRNVILSAEQTKNLFTSSQVSGQAVEVLEKSFINVGKSIKDINKEMLQVREISAGMGVSASAVSKVVVDNLQQLNRVGFQNGVQGLAKMAAHSTALGVDMSKTVELADSLTSIDKSIETASFFQRIGATSAALTNGLSLSDMAMNDTEKLQDELGNYLSTLTKLNEETGQFEIIKGERGKIKEIADQLGYTRSEVEKLGLSYRDMAEKTEKISFSGFKLDEETQDLVKNMAVMGEGGEYVIKTKGEDGQLTEKSIQQFLTDTKGDKEKIKEDLGVDKPLKVDDLSNAQIDAEMERIASSQLSTQQSIDAGISALNKAPGITMGASELGRNILEANKVLAQSINDGISKQFKLKDDDGNETKYATSLDNFNTTVEKALNDAKKPDANLNQIAKDLMDGGVEFTKNLSGVAIEAATDVAKNVGVDIPQVKSEYLDVFSKEKDELPPTLGKEKIDLPPNKKDELPPTLGKEKIDLPPNKKDELPSSSKSKDNSELIGTDKPITLITNEVLLTDLNPKPNDSINNNIDSQDINNLDNELLLTLQQNLTQLTSPKSTQSISGFEPMVGPPIASVDGMEGFNLEDFIPLNKFISQEMSPEMTPTPTPNKQILDTDFIKNFVQELKIDPTLLMDFVQNEVTQQEYKPTEIVAEEGISNLDITAKALGINQEDLSNVTQQVLQTDKVEPNTEPITELKIDTSEVETLNVKNLNIGDSLTELLTAGKKTEGEETNYDKIQKLIQEGLVGEATAGDGVLFKPTAEQAIAQEGITVPIPKMDAQDELPELTEELPQTLPTGKTRGIFKKTKQDEEPSAYEGYKKLLEEISGSEIVGKGKDAFFLNDEMKESAKKDSKFIGPETPTERDSELLVSELPDKKIELGGPKKPMGLSSNFNPEIGLPKTTKDLFSKKEIEYDEMDMDEKDEFFISKGLEFKKEGEKIKKQENLSEEDNNILKSIESRKKKYFDYSDKIDFEEVDPYSKIQSKGLIEDKGLSPIKPTLQSLPIPDKVEKPSLGKRIKEGIGDLKEKFKGEQEDEKPITSVPETSKTFVARDVEGNIVGESIDKETARKMAGGKAFTFEEKTQTVPPIQPETPAVGVEKAAAEAEEKTPFKEKLKDKLKNLIKEKPDDSESKITIKEPSEIESIQPETKKETSSLSNFKGSTTKIVDGKTMIKTPNEILNELKQQKVIEEDVQLKEEEKNGYLKMLEEDNVKADKFLTSKSGRPVNLDETESNKIDIKSIEKSASKEKADNNFFTNKKTSPFNLDMSEFTQKLPKAPKASLEVEEEKFKVPTQENVSQSDEDLESFEPTMEFAEDGNIRTFSGLPENPVENERQQSVREAQEKQLSFLEELRLKEQTPDTPVRGIEKLAQVGQKLGGKAKKFFGQTEEEVSLTDYEPETSTEESYISNPIKDNVPQDISEYDVSEVEQTPTPKLEGKSENYIDILNELRSNKGGELSEQQNVNEQNINIKATIEIIGSPEFAKMLDPRKFQSKIEEIFSSSIGKPQFAQKVKKGTDSADIFK